MSGSGASACMCVYPHTDSYTRARYMHIRHVYIHSFVHPFIHPSMHAFIHSFIVHSSNIHAFTHTLRQDIYIYIYIYIYTCTHTQAHKRLRLLMLPGSKRILADPTVIWGCTWRTGCTQAPAQPSQLTEPGKAGWLEMATTHLHTNCKEPGSTNVSKWL